MNVHRTYSERLGAVLVLCAVGLIVGEARAIPPGFDRLRGADATPLTDMDVASLGVSDATRAAAERSFIISDESMASPLSGPDGNTCRSAEVATSPPTAPYSKIDVVSSRAAMEGAVSPAVGAERGRSRGSSGWSSSAVGGDTCATATVISGLPYADSGNTCSFADDYDEICPMNEPSSPDVVYVYSPSVDEVVDISLCGNSAYDTKLTVYSNVCGAYLSGTAYACNDDSCTTPSYSVPYVSKLAGVSLFSGGTYYIVVDGWGGDCGDYTLDIEQAAPDGDTCATATVTPVPVGAAGSPVTTTINGDSTAATGPDCDGSILPSWWEAFTIDRCSKVTIDFCGTSPSHNLNYINLVGSCENGGSSCGDWVGADSYSRADCGDNNMTMYYDAIPAGTYYYPLIAESPERQHAYVMHITAEECAGGCWGCLGACCNTGSETCADFVTPDTCTGVNEYWQLRAECCEMECRDPAGPEYDSWNVNLLSSVPISSFSSGSFEANDVWGYVSPQGHRYAIIGLDRGTGFVDITDPRNPVVIDDIPDSYSIWSDQAVYGEYAYNVNESSGGMQIIDMTDIDNGNIVLTGSALGNLNTAHNVFVNEESGHAYACGDDWGFGFAVYDVSNPAIPFPVGLWGDQYVHDMQVVNYASCPTDAGYSRYHQPCEIAFLFTGYTTGIYIVDVTDKSNMVTLSTMTYPTIAYCHQGWLSEDRRHLFFNDEIDESWGNVGNVTTYVVDVQNLSSPSLVDTFAGPSCNIDHNLITRGDRIYQAHYSAGLRVVDASNPLSLSEVGYFDTHPENNIKDYVGAWGVYPFPNDRIVLISDIERGLFVLCDEPNLPIPSFTITPNPVLVGETAQISALSSTHCDPSKSIVSYEWDLDYDGVTFVADFTGVSFSIVPAVELDYEIALRVTDNAPANRSASAASSAIITHDFVAVASLCTASSAAVADDGCCPDDGFGRNVRYLSLTAGDAGEQQAIRVTLANLEAPFNTYNGQVLWVGHPVEVTENAGKTDPNDPLVAGFPTYWAAELQCDPHYMDWHGVCSGGTCTSGMLVGKTCLTYADCQGVVHVYHETIVPSSTYVVEVVKEGCSTTVPGNYSIALAMSTSIWGDAVKDCGGPQCGPPDGIINITTDVTAVLNKFKNLAGAPIKARADLDKETPDMKVNISDVTYCLEGFGGFSYPFPAAWAGCP